MKCCSCTGESQHEDYFIWSDHPAREQWEVLKDLGEGAFSQVVLARHRHTRELAALKVVFLESPAADPEHMKMLTREAELLPLLDHPNIVECKDVIRSPRQLVMVLEWLRGGQVIDRLHDLGPNYSEQQAAELFQQMAQAVAYLHEYGVLHRDIKPENVLFAEPPETSRVRYTAGQAPHHVPLVKLADLGMAAHYNPDDLVVGPLGSPGFVAPEVVKNGPHTPAMDVFSLGVLLFIMLVGRKPFNIKESESLQYAFMQLQDAPGFRDPRWLDLSPDAKHLLMSMLTFDPKRRLTAKQVLEHEWVVSKGGRLPRPLGQDVVHGAATVATVRRLKNLCHGVAALSRATQIATSGGKRQTDSASSRDEYVRRLKSLQKDLSMRGSVRTGGSSSGGRYSRPGPMQGLALNLASKSYSKLHDAGRSADPSLDPSRSRRLPLGLPPTPANSINSRQLEASLSQHSNRWWLGGGLQKAGTSVLLSEVDRQEDFSTRNAALRGGVPKSMSMSTLGTEASCHDHTAHSCRPPRPSPGSRGGSVKGEGSVKQQGSLNTLQLLRTSIKQYVDASLHGMRSARGAGGAREESRHGGGSGHGGGSWHGKRVSDTTTQDTSTSSGSSTDSPAVEHRRRAGAQQAQRDNEPATHGRPTLPHDVPGSGQQQAQRAQRECWREGGRSLSSDGTMQQRQQQQQDQRGGEGSGSTDSESGRRHAQGGSKKFGASNSSGHGGFRVVQLQALENPLLPAGFGKPPQLGGGPRGTLRWEDVHSMQGRSANSIAGRPSRRVVIIRPLE